ncbi:hypothetical protein LIA77_05912 [Sarocladium implicatum]|nr:hypothetical protein LIA77_05912 [Sarocladium implicatum]
MAFLYAASPEAGVHGHDDYFHARRAAQPSRINTRTALDGRTNPGDLQKQDVASEAANGASIARRNVVFPDSLAFRYLSQDPCVNVIERRRVLTGFELYLVEQWACSRESPTLVVVTYTGDEKHSIVVGILSIPEDESKWSPKVHAYFKATRQYLARPKDTELGQVLVTNLSSFPSALTVIPVADGDLHKHRQTFIVNEDLKRLGCSGRSGLALTEPTEATQAKFHQLYKTSDRIPFSQSVLELVKMCQVALYMFEKLDHAYIDGLLCDVTETAIGNWWTQVGAEHYNFEPSDGILGPTTVAALLGMLMGARNRLHWFGAPVSKDVFDVDATKRGIAHFQKTHKLEKTRRLDRQTLIKLHSVTAKAAVGEGWGVQKAVKSTMADIGGKRGEMVMGMVAGKDKGGIADIESLDIDTLISLVHGERPKWLWYGKARRTFSEHQDRQDTISNALSRSESFQEAARRTQSMPMPDESNSRSAEDPATVYTDTAPGSALSVVESHSFPVERDPHRKGVFKSVAGKMSDARSGFGRIKDAVGGNRRAHNSRPSITTSDDLVDQPNGGLLSPTHTSTTDFGTVTPGVPRAFTWKNKPEEYLTAIRADSSRVSLGLPQTSRDPSPSGDGSRERRAPEDVEREKERELNQIGTEIRKGVLPNLPSAVASVADETDFQGPLAGADRKSDSLQLELTRRHSMETAVDRLTHHINENRWPRRMSFGDAEEAILTWEEVVSFDGDSDDPKQINALGEVARHMFDSIAFINTSIEPWVDSKLRGVSDLQSRYASTHAELEATHLQLHEACQRMRHRTAETLSDERTALEEAVRDIEALVARLDYEVDALGAKVRDVEDGAEGFERQVEDVERKADALRVQLETESWMHWLVRTVTGVGMGPNITRMRT